MRIILASNNQHKVDEFKKVLFPLGYNVISLKEAQIEVEPVHFFLYLGYSFEKSLFVRGILCESTSCATHNKY